ncbi:MAG TPA: DPP IV N-terminal domain-containing protein [Bryobacteraceae bacterium]|nr:DPP IV N-terminal domain-containing protein [Bryobacteraceae bacterium]
MTIRLNTVLFAAGLLALTLAAADDTVPPNGTAATISPAGAAVKHNKANYELAARWTPAKVGKMVFDTAVTPHWMDAGDRFWYSWENNNGRKYYIVDPAKKSKSLVFDPPKLAAALTAATGLPHDSQHLNIRNFKFVKNEGAIQFEIDVPRDANIPGEKKAAAAAQQTPSDDDADDDPQQRNANAGGGPANPRSKTLAFEYDLVFGKLALLDERPARKPRWASVSPDDKTIVFARNHNLYMMDAANYAKALKKADDPTIVETQLTTDGTEDFGYTRRMMDQDRLEIQREQQDQQQTTDTRAGEGQGQDKNARVPSIAIFWARDSKKFAVVRQDQRKVAKLWVINVLSNPRPTLESYSYVMPGEANAPQPKLEVFDLAAKSRTQMKADGFKDQSISVETERATARAREHDKNESVWAGPGSDKLYFSRISRDMHRVDVCVADTATGEVKPLIEERMNVYIDSKPLRVINNGAELLFWSERDGWGHYYLYDTNGKLKNQITHGEFVAEDIMGVDEKARVAYITADGREDGEDPYYVHMYRVNLDGSGMKLLDAGDESHTINMSDDARYFVDTSSRVNSAPKSVLFDPQGTALLPLETTDLNPMIQAGYKFPEPFKVKADDGITDLYGVMYKPFDFDPAKKYPIIAFVYPGPQTEQVTKTFTPRSASLMLSQLGFVVIEVGNRGGNPHRSKWYHTFGYGNLRDYGLADKKAAVEQLAERYPFIDIDRVGIWGHSGGGFMSAAAMLIYPDFFKVAVSESGNHENNIYNRSWSEKHHGVKEVTDKDGTVHFEYQIEKNSDIAKNLKGHLLLSTGDIDDNVHPGNTMRLVDALIKANKRFDMIVLPGQRHGYGPVADYFSWIRADYFCKYLLGDFDQSVDMWELNREKQQAIDKENNTRQQQQQGQQRRRGAE